MGMARSPGVDLKPGADCDKAGRDGEDPELVRVQEMMEFRNDAGECGKTGARPGKRRHRHGQGREAAAHAMQGHHCGMGDVGVGARATGA